MGKSGIPRVVVVSLLLTFALGAKRIDGNDRALSLYNHTRYKEAIAILEQAPAGDAATLELLGRCYFGEGRYKKASDILEKAVALDPDNSMTALFLGRAYGRRAETSFPLNAVGLAVKSRQWLERAVELDPRNPEAVGDLFDFYIAAPGMVGGGIEKAKALIPTIAKYDPAEEHFSLARIAEERKQYDVAEAEMRRSIELTPHRMGRLPDLAKFLAKRGRFEESEATFARAEKMSPGDPRMLYFRAETYVATKRNLDQARELLGRYIRDCNLTPHDPGRDEAQKLLKKVEQS